MYRSRLHRKPVINQQMIDGNFACYPHVVEGLYVTLGFVSSGGVVLRWYRDTLAQAETAQATAEGRDVYDIYSWRIFPIHPEQRWSYRTSPVRGHPHSI